VVQRAGCSWKQTSAALLVSRRAHVLGKGQRKVSVLTPVGTALIGLLTGHSMTWQAPNGELRQLTVISERLHLRFAAAA
jgi:transcription elongation GreA/GreB family factor